MKNLILTSLIICISFSLFAKKVKQTKVKMKTTMGEIVLVLYNETPLHRDNFKKLAKNHFYDSLLFHRVIKDFMIQGGDPQSKRANATEMLGDGDAPGSRIPAEFKTNLYIHKKGALAAARDGNPEKASSNCQFYIVQGKTFTDADLKKLSERTGVYYTESQATLYKTIGGTPHLDGSYTVFGEVIKGLEIVDAIAKTQTGTADRPVVDVRILKCKVR
jgi:peptidyl-prolyl cis-trans isomerase B (cyclophilin B)